MHLTGDGLQIVTYHDHEAQPAGLDEDQWTERGTSCPLATTGSQGPHSPDGPSRAALSHHPTPQSMTVTRHRAGLGWAARGSDRPDAEGLKTADSNVLSHIHTITHIQHTVRHAHTRGRQKVEQRPVHSLRDRQTKTDNISLAEGQTRGSPAPAAQVAAALASSFIRANSVYNAEVTEASRAAARQAVEPSNRMEEIIVVVCQWP